MASNIKGITIEIGGNTLPLEKALKSVNDKTFSLQGELKEVNRLLKLDPKNTELLAQKQRILSQSIENTKEKLSALKEAEKQVQQQFEKGNVSEAQYQALQREIIQTEQTLKKLEDQSSKTNQVLKKVSEASDKMAAGMDKAGKAMLPLSGVIAGAGVASVTMATQFADSVAKVSTIADTALVPMEDLKKKILDLSNQTGISANLIADDVYNAISAGQSTTDAVNFVANSTKLAKAGFAESSQALDILTTILNAYGLEAEKVTDVSDMLIQVQNKGKTTVAELSANMGKVIPTAKGQNVALEQLGAGYAIMTSKGIATAETTTYLNGMINELGKSSSISAKLLKEQTGNSFSELMASGKSLADVLKIVDDDAKKSGKSMGDMFGSAEASKAALTLLDGGVESFNKSVVDMQNSVGATDEAFEKLQTPSERLNISLNSIKNSAIKLGDVLMPLFEDVADGISVLSDKLSKLNKDELKNIAVTAGVVASAGPLLITGGKLIKGVKSLAVASKALWGVMVANPIGLLVVAVAACTAAMGYLIVTMYDESESEKAARLEHEKMIATMHEQNQAWDDMKQAQEDSRDSNLNEMDSVQSLWQELRTLADENGNVKEANKNRASFIMGELNTALGTELTMTGSQIQGYKDAAIAIGELIEKKKAQIILDSQEPLYKKAVLEVNDKMYAQSKLALEMAQKQVELNSLEAAKAYAKTGQGKRVIEDMRTQLSEKERLYVENEATINDYYKTIASYEETATAITSGNYEKIKEINVDFGESFKKAGEAMDSELKEQVSIMALSYADIQQKAKNGVEGVTQKVVDEARANYQKAIVEYEKTGGAIPEGLKRGIDAKAPDVIEAAGIFIKSIKEWFTGVKGFDTHSPSRFTQSVGLNIMGGLLLGLQSAWESVVSWVSEKVNWLKETISSALSFDFSGGDGTEQEERSTKSKGLLSYSRANIPLLAKGGVLSTGAAIVGEVGPELLTMINGKTVVRPLSGKEKSASDKILNAGFEKVINQTLIFNTPKTPSPAQTARLNRRAVQQLLPKSKGG